MMKRFYKKKLIWCTLVTILSFTYIWGCGSSKEDVVIEKTIIPPSITKVVLRIGTVDYIGVLTDTTFNFTLPVGSTLPSSALLNEVVSSTNSTTSPAQGENISLNNGNATLVAHTTDGTNKSYTLNVTVTLVAIPPSITKVVLRIGTVDYIGVLTDTTFNFTLPVGSTLPSTALLNEVVSSTNSTTSPAQGENISLNNGNATLVVRTTDGNNKSYTLNVTVTLVAIPPSITKVVLRIGTQDYTGILTDKTFNFTLPVGSTLPSTALLNEVVSSTNSTTSPAQGENITLTNGQASIALSSTGSTNQIFTISVKVGTTVSQIKLHDSYQYVAQYLMETTEYNDWIKNNAFNQDAKLKALVKNVFIDFKDAFDFIFLVLNEDKIPSGITYYGQLISVSNKVTGIGISPSDNTAEYGSSGKLKSVMILTTKEGISFGPSLHELAHTWANFAINTTGVLNQSNQPNYEAIPHWGFTGGSDKGQLGGFKQSTLETNINGNPNKYRVQGFGGFANGGNSYPYTELELYLMGLIPLSEVNPFDVFSGISNVEYNSDTDKASFVATTKKRYGSAEILSDCGGARIPSSANSQKEFRLLTLILTNTALSDTDFAYFNNQAEKFSRNSNYGGENEYNFWKATGGRASLNAGNLADEKK